MILNNEVNHDNLKSIHAVMKKAELLCCFCQRITGHSQSLTNCARDKVNAAPKLNLLLSAAVVFWAAQFSQQFKKV